MRTAYGKTAHLCAPIVTAAILALSTPALAQNTLNLSTPGATGEIGGAIYNQVDIQPAGTGQINSFLRLQRGGSEQGYNTDFRPVEFDEKTDPNFTRSIRLSQIPQVTIGGNIFRELILDVNEPQGAGFKSLITLDRFQIFLGAAPDNHGYAQSESNLGIKVYDMDAGLDHAVVIDAGLSHGSGSSDITINIPEAAFTAAPIADPYVYTYVRFGASGGFPSQGGFEELAARVTNPLNLPPGTSPLPIPAPAPGVNPVPVPVVPLPAAAPVTAVTLLGMATIQTWRKRRAQQLQNI